MNLSGRLLYSGSCLFVLTRGVILAAVFLTVVHFFIATIFVVDGISMEPNLHTGQITLINRINYLLGDPARGDIVVVRFPGDPEKRKFIKRLVGLPGETIDLDDKQIIVNGIPLNEPYLARDMLTPIMMPNETHWQLGPNEYFLVGDNRPNSNDSRTWGAADRGFVIGKAVFVLWPWGSAGII